MLDRYNPILTAIKDNDPTAHIAGGAVRDTLLERPIRDIDLFIDEFTTDAAAELLRSQFGFVKVGEWKSYEKFSDPLVVRVAKFEKADEDIPICLIGLRQLSESLGEKYPIQGGMLNNLFRFDFAICMAAWDGEKVYTAPEYTTDVERKTFTLRRADNRSQFNYSMSRFEKMTADRYAGWRLVVPKQFKALEREHARKKTHYFDDDAGAWKLRNRGEQQLSPKAR